MSNKKNVKLGAIYTPKDVAQVMIRWAITSKDDKVLDLGIGGGAFIFAAQQALSDLGAVSLEATQQIYGCEIDANAFNEFTNLAHSRGLSFPNLVSADFFKYRFPADILFDAVIGNPPYVRRFGIQDVEHIRKVVLDSTGIKAEDLKNLSDLYIYFMLYAATKLRPGGRFCVVTADSWLNVGYGRILKKFLNDHFRIENLLTLDRNLFPKADVRAVILHAVKLGTHWPIRSVTTFTRVYNGMSLDQLPIYTPNTEYRATSFAELHVNQDDLDPKKQWGIFFKIGDLYQYLSTLTHVSTMSQIADTQIGYQTLAKDFFIIPAEKTDIVESVYLRPIAHAPRKYTKTPVIKAGDKADYLVFYCDQAKDNLVDQKVLEYIQAAESKEVSVRGKGKTVIGYQSKERIKKARRPHWYDIRTYLEKRSPCQILVPRFIFENYAAVWNQAGYITGEMFLDFKPKLGLPTELYLGILNSSFAELMFRVHAQIYGGGTNNMSPGEFKNVPTVDPAFLGQADQRDLIEAYRDFLSNNLRRDMIDGVINRILGLDADTVEKIRAHLVDLRQLSLTVKKS